MCTRTDTQRHTCTETHIHTETDTFLRFILLWRNIMTMAILLRKHLIQRFSPLSSLWEAQQHAGRHDADKVVESSEEKATRYLAWVLEISKLTSSDTLPPTRQIKLTAAGPMCLCEEQHMVFCSKCSFSPSPQPCTRVPVSPRLGHSLSFSLYLINVIFAVLAIKPQVLHELGKAHYQLGYVSP